MLTRLLKDRKTNSYIVCRIEIASLFVPQIGFFHIQKKLVVEGAKMTCHKGIVSVVIVRNDVVRVGPWGAYLFLASDEKVSIDKPGLFSLEGSTEKFKHLSS